MSTGTAKLVKRTPSFTSYLSSGSSSSESGATNDGITNPLHWDNLSEEVRKQLEKGPITGSTGAESSTSQSGPSSTETTGKKRHSSAQPPGTFEHTVGARDTLVSIAARYDISPSFLKKLNHLTSSLIFPGQVLFIPSKDYKAPSPTSPPPDTTVPTDGADAVPLSPRSAVHPGHAERLKSTSSEEGRSTPVEIEPPKPLSEDEAKKLDQECYERFIKVNVKHITDGMGVVNGVLLVTPNAVMFDPDVMDTLVTEHGADTYGMITPMEMIMSAALYHDIAAMKVKGVPDEETLPSQKSAVYHGEDLRHSNPSSPSTEQPPTTMGEDLESIKEVDPQADEETQETLAEDSVKSTGLETSDDGILINFDVPEDGGNEDAPSEPPADGDHCVSVGNSAEVVPVFSLDTQEAACGGDTPMVAVNSPTREDSGLSLENLPLVERKQSIDIAIQTDVTITALAVTSAPSIQTNDLPVGVTSRLPADKRPASLDMTSAAQPQSSDCLQAAMPDMPGLSPHMQIGSITYFQYDDQPETPGEKKEEAEDSESNGEKRMASSSSWVNLPSVPSLKNFVDFSSGLFSSKQDEVGKVQDIHEIPALERQSSSTWYSSSESEASMKDNSKNKSKDSKKSAKSKKSKKKKSDVPVEVVSIVKPDEMKALFQSPSDLIPSPAIQYEDPPLYLCLKVGMPVNKRVSKTCPIESYSKKKRKPEYWFSIPRDKVDHLYAFFIQWSPNVYGSEEEIDPKERGFVVMESDEEDLFVAEPGNHKKLSKQMSKDWEIVNIEEARRRLSLLDVEDALPLPELLQPSIIFSEKHIRQLSKNLPARAESYPWTLVYSTEKNGFSLNTLYRNMHDCDTPVLLVVKDTFGRVFGVMTSCELKLNDHFYGTGESFLFTFVDDDLLIFHWTGENSFFIRGSKESLAFGAGEGSFGLWLDSDFYHGRTKSCKTYENPPLTEQEDFFIAAIEAWGFF